MIEIVCWWRIETYSLCFWENKHFCYLWDILTSCKREGSNLETHHIRLTSSEIGGLWANYIADSMFCCVYKYYLAKVEDSEIQTV
ncbi:DUF3231 family protein [Mesobacillus persicus]|uniref:DUF3231 family protein n=1 Tax=Mesobacillus persicus TaxID=930146 RepID=UPI000B82CB1E